MVKRCWGKKATGNGSDKDTVKNKIKEVKDAKKVLHKHEEVSLTERSASRKLWWGLSRHMVMQGHVCGDVFDMCWAHRGAMWLEPQQHGRNRQRQTSLQRLLCRPAFPHFGTQSESSVSVFQMWRDRIVIAPCLHESTVHDVAVVCLWLTIPAVAWSGPLLQETGSRSWSCLVPGDASAFLDTQHWSKTVRYIECNARRLQYILCECEWSSFSHSSSTIHTNKIICVMEINTISKANQSLHHSDSERLVTFNKNPKDLKFCCITVQPSSLYYAQSWPRKNFIQSLSTCFFSIFLKNTVI